MLFGSGKKNLTMTQKKDDSRFDDLFGAVEGGAEGTPQPTERKQAKGNNPNYVRSTFYLSKQIHRQLKKAAIDE